MTLTARERYILHHTMLTEAGIAKGFSPSNTKRLIEAMKNIRSPELSDEDVEGIVKEIKQEVSDSVEQLAVTKASDLKVGKKEQPKGMFFNFKDD